MVPLYHLHHSTKSALMKVVNDILLTLVSASVLLLLDLSAAFDSIDHSLLSDKPESQSGHLWPGSCFAQVLPNGKNTMGLL